MRNWNAYLTSRLNTGSKPFRKNISVVAVTVEISSGMIDATVMSSIRISSTKTTPVIGALNTAERAPAAPQQSSSVMSR